MDAGTTMSFRNARPLESEAEEDDDVCAGDGGDGSGADAKVTAANASAPITVSTLADRNQVILGLVIGSE